MKNIALFLAFVFAQNVFANPPQKSIYTEKIKKIVNALPVGNFDTDKEYFDMLKVSCKRNNCSPLEQQGIKAIGHQVVHCKTKHLKTQNIENKDATSICETKLPMLGCDTLATPLLRKMCYTSNSYNLQVLKLKEFKIRKRLPASKGQ
ncbi:MAG: hypothetical protein AAF203_03360 [Pseudomonadota bacterium]